MTVLQKWYRKTNLLFLMFRNWCSSLLRHTTVSVSEIMLFFFYKFQSLQPSSKSLTQHLLLLHAEVLRKAG